MLALASVVVALLACELVLRALPDDNARTTATLGVYANDPELRWVLKPDYRASRSWGGREVVIRTDHDGHRIADHEATAAIHDAIAVGGDSYVYGNEVNADETFVHLVGRALGQGRITINLGVGGYSLAQECLALRRYLRAHSPIRHAFLVIYIGNDVEWGADSGHDISVTEDGFLIDMPRYGWTPAEYYLVVHSKLAFQIHKALHVVRTRWSAPVATPASRRGPYRWIYDPRAFTVDRIAAHERVIAALRDDARDAGVPLTVVLMPEDGQVYGSLSDLPNRMLAAMVSRLGLPVIDLLPAMREAAPNRPPLYHQFTSGHLSPAGHRVVAKVLLHYLSRSATPAVLAERSRRESS